jgi:hypothetical protein
VEVEKQDKSLNFVAQNISWYPYTLELEFSNLVNLTPAMNKYKMVVYPGKSNLFRLTVVDDKYAHDYSYGIRFMIGDYHKKPDPTFPYLLPFSEGKLIRLTGIEPTNDSSTFRKGFPVTAGDTILCMRKGMVTSVPGLNEKFDRILKSSIEVMHMDGTVASYALSEADQVLVSPGQVIYPLQPLAIVKSSGNFVPYVFQLSEGNGIRSFSINFEKLKGDPSNQNPATAHHDRELIEKELTGKEKKKLIKGTLF